MGVNFDHVEINDLPQEIHDRIVQAIRDFQDRPRPRIVLVGRTGVGKSSCINMLRGLTDTDEGAAPVGDYGETRMLRTVYTYFGIDFEDLPGSDGVFQDLPLGQEYIDEFQLHLADAILLLWERAFDRTLTAYARLLINRYRRPVFFIRTKLDFVAAQAISHGLASNDEEVMQNVRVRAQQEIAALGGLAQLVTNERLFFISTKILHNERFDAPRLLHEIPRSILDEAVATRVRGLFTGGLDDFVAGAERSCRRMVPLYCAAAGACGVIPIPMVGVASASGILMKATHDFMKAFGLTSDAFPGDEWARMIKSLLAALAAKVSLLVGASTGAEVANSAMSTSMLVIPVFALVVEIVGGAIINVTLTRKVLDLVIRKLATSARIMYGATLEKRAGRARLADTFPRILNEVDGDSGE